MAYEVQKTVTTICRKLPFDAGHRIVGHENKCANLHGHRYTVTVTARSLELDPLGRVVDFGVLKQLLGGWLDEFWDHTMLVWERDPMLDALCELAQNKPVFVAPFNPTAENIALFLLHDICPDIFNDMPFAIVAVEVQETPNCTATVTLPQAEQDRVLFDIASAAADKQRLSEESKI